ncbi:hypothetical protein BDV96DRAFT_684663 [Lophiotrema nucula]|uniref:Uncharacterized protein n=1 Tax=Lophiotrema nucula TaxID=690887 RepID=A0A6A5ZHV5_9PLEO|nr:hypothetical protein BDV96DRAFT_684663 [Lophiotrema nucula]
MQDSSVWSIRDIVRSFEQKRLYPKSGFQEFLNLHEASRHAIHSLETLKVTVETMGALQQHISRIPNELIHCSEESERPLQPLQTQVEFQVRILRSLLHRAQANKERLQNEISLAYNMIAQRDSQVMTGLGEAAKLDSGAMKTIAIVTMGFLPPTFLSAIFSMSFFSYAPGKSDQYAEWSVS